MEIEQRDGVGGRFAERAVGERSEAAGRSERAVPDPELVEQPKRRRFTAEYKLRILKEAEACSRPGEIGALLRREGLYSGHLSKWRRQREAGALEALERPRGRKPADRREYLALLDRLGFDRGVLVQPSAYGRDNRAMLDALTRVPSRLRGVAVGGAELDASTLKQWHAAGVRGLRANEFRRDGKPYYQNGVTLKEVQPLLPAMADLGWHLQLWIDTRDLPDLLPALA